MLVGKVKSWMFTVEVSRQRRQSSYVVVIDLLLPRYKYIKEHIASKPQLTELFKLPHVVISSTCQLD